MTNDVALKEPRSLDEFADWTDEVESRDEQVSERAIIGQLVRFTNEGQWLLPEQVQLTKPLIVVNVRRTVTKWGKDKNGRSKPSSSRPARRFPTWRSATKKRRSPNGSKASTASRKVRGKRSTSSTWSIRSASTSTAIPRPPSAAASLFVS